MATRQPAANMFNRGDLLQAIYFPDDTHFKVGDGNLDCDEIIVTIENGQMAGVPWIECWKDGKIDTKWNAALLAGVKY